MEDLRRGFKDEPADMPAPHEATPPEQPDKPPLDEPSGMPWAQKERSLRHGDLTNCKLRSSSNTLTDHDATDAAVSEPDSSATVLTFFRTQHSREQDEGQSLRREMKHLQTRLKEANSRADQAERAAEELERRLRSRTSGITVGVDGSSDVVAALKAENQELRTALDDARSHIFSLQPYRKDLTPNEVGQEFDDLVSGITDFVTKLIDPILDGDNTIYYVVATAKKRHAGLLRLRGYMQRHGDLIHASMFPETDIDIMVAIILRFLQDNIFHKILFGAVSGTVEVLNSVAGSMQTNVEPRRDLFALRTWRAEALNAVICSADYQRARSARIKDMTIEVAFLFKVFKKDKDFSKLCYVCQDHVVEPAVKLHEKLLTSTHHFYLDLNPYVMWNSRQELETSPDFFDDLPKLKCENILQNRKPFNVTKLNPRPTREQLYQQLVMVATVVPALLMRQVGKGSVIKDPIIVRPQQVLVAWGSREKKDKFLADGEHTLMHRLCYSHRW
ncbi:hypothetical protein C8A03DRAFT_15155 [Achaetomium macrosporum]|uniref:Uncharacterized protein n=1 Tax=Achaetomium macrosporum TaxID=79813 RepID=A0AAN7CC95_9PEZI|nr:hypothetical protein C8A03DRAFT_15155 [Achaetomium macrosporum]